MGLIAKYVGWGGVGGGGGEGEGRFVFMSWLMEAFDSPYEHSPKKSQNMKITSESTNNLDCWNYQRDNFSSEIKPVSSLKLGGGWYNSDGEVRRPFLSVISGSQFPQVGRGGGIIVTGKCEDHFWV